MPGWTVLNKKPQTPDGWSVLNRAGDDWEPAGSDTIQQQAEAAAGMKLAPLKPLKPELSEVPYIDSKTGNKGIGAETYGKILGKAGNAWDRLTESPDAPLVNIPEPERAASGVGAGQKIVRGVGRSAARNASSLTTPKNLAILGGLGLLNATQFSPLAPVAVPVAQAANATAATYFGWNAAKELPSMVRRYNEKLKEGDTEGAAEALTDIGATTAIAAGGAKGGVEMPLKAGRSAAGLEPLKPLISERAQTRMALERQAEEARAAQASAPVDMGIRPLGPRESIGSDLPLRPTPGKPMPGRPISELKSRLLEKKAAKNAAAAEEQRMVDEALAEPVPAAEQGWQVFKSAEEAAKAFENEPPKSAEQSAAVFRKQRPEVPETGIPEEQARLEDARERMAVEYAGKDWTVLSPEEKSQIDAWIDENNRGQAGREKEVLNDREIGQPVQAGEPYGQKPGQLRQPSGSGAPGEAGPVLQEQGEVRGGPSGEQVPAVPPDEGLRQVGGRTRRTTQEQGGFLRIFSKKAHPANPVDAYIQKQVQEREAARAPQSNWLTKLRSAKDLSERELIDSTIPLTNPGTILDPLTPKGTVPFSYRMNSLIDAALKPSSAASERLHKSGMVDLIRDTQNIDTLDQLMIARHAADVATQGFKTGRDAALDQAVIQQKSNEVAIPAANGRPAMTYGQVADAFTKYGDGLLQSAVDSGLVSTELAGQLRKMYPNYVPLNRVMEVLSAPDGFGGGQVASIGRQTIVQRLHGSAAPIENPLASIIERTLKVESQVARNEAGKYLVDSITGNQKTSPLMRRMLPDEHVDSGRSLTVFRDGKPVRYETTPEIAAAAKTLDRAQLGLIAKLALPATRALKLGATGLSLPFAVVNVLADMGHTFVTSPQGLASVADPRVLMEAAKASAHGLFGYKNKTMETMLAHGGGFTSFDVARGPALENIADIRASRSAGARASYTLFHPVKSFEGAFRHAENFLSRSEQFSRARLYEAARRDYVKQGYSANDAEMMAVVESNNALPNYSRAGNIGRVLNATIPYLNAGIQGSRSLVRAFKRDPYGTSAKLATIYLAVGTAAQWNLSDDKRRNAYNDIEEYERKHNLIIIPDNPEKDAHGKWKVFKMKLPQGIDELAWPITRLVEQVNGQRPLSVGDVASSVVGGLTPVEPTVPGIIRTVTPQAIKPAIQAVANYDLYRQTPKVPANLQDLPPEQQSKPYTSETAKAIGGKVAPALGVGPVSPIKTEEFLRDTFSGLADAGLRGSDYVGGKLGLWKDTGLGGKNPIEAAAARFETARGGALQRQQYEVKAQIRDIITNAGVNFIRKMPEFEKLDAKGQAHEMNSILGKVNALLRDVEQDEEFQAMDDTQRLKVYQGILKSVQNSKPEELLDLID